MDAQKAAQTAKRMVDDAVKNPQVVTKPSGPPAKK